MSGIQEKNWGFPVLVCGTICVLLIGLWVVLTTDVLDYLNLDQPSQPAPPKKCDACEIEERVKILETTLLEEN